MESQRKYGNWRDKATKNGWRKYFRSLERGKSGVLGNSERKYKVREFCKYELTTKEGMDNTWETMSKHHKALILELRKRGCELEYFACGELTPSRGLLHVHGIFRGEKFPNQRELSKIWEKIHGAFRVWLEQPRSEYSCVEYMSKHVVKEYPVMSELGSRLLISKGWMPENWSIVKELLDKAAIKAVANGREKERAWSMVQAMYGRWCIGKATLPVPVKNMGAVVLCGQKVIMGGEKYEMKEFAELAGLENN